MSSEPAKVMIYNKRSDLYLGVKSEHGMMFVTLVKRENADVWSIIQGDFKGSNDITPNYRLVEGASNLAAEPIVIGEDINLILKSTAEVNRQLFKISRSGFGTSMKNFDLSEVNITNIEDYNNLTADGKEGDKIKLTEQKENDEEQEFILII